MSASVTLAFRIQPSGRVDPCSVEAVGNPDPAFESSARQTLLGVQYTIPTRAGRPVHASARQKFRFEARDKVVH